MLPKITHPTIDLTIPSTKTKITLRPMLTREEKILLIAKQSDKKTDKMSAIKKVVSACVESDGVNVDKLTIFDIEYLFIRLRAFSVNNITRQTYRDMEDDKSYEFEIDLNNINVKFPEKINNTIMVPGNDIKIVLRWPNFSFFERQENEEHDYETLLENMILENVTEIRQGTKLFDVKTTPKEELKKFLFEDMDISTYGKLREFFLNQPELYHKITYTNSKGTERTIELRGLEDFFTLD